MKLRDWEIDMNLYSKKVEKSKIKNKEIKQLMSDIIGFYNREDKPAWREFFDRRTKSDEESMEALCKHRDPGNRDQENYSVWYTCRR